MKSLKIIIVVLTLLIFFLTIWYFYTTYEYKNFNEEIEEALVQFTKEYCGKDVEIKEIKNRHSWMYSHDRSISWYVENNIGEHYGGNYNKSGAVLLLSSPCMAIDTSQYFILNRKEKRFYVDESNIYFENIKLPPGWKSYTPSPGGIPNLDIRVMYIYLLMTYFVLVILLLLLYWVLKKRMKADMNTSEESINKVVGYYITNFIFFIPYVFVVGSILNRITTLLFASVGMDLIEFILLCLLFQTLTFVIIRKVKSRWWHVIITGLFMGFFWISGW